MKSFKSELQYLDELYRRFKTVIMSSSEPTPHRNSAALAESVLRHSELMLQIEQMTARTSQLASEWDKFRMSLDPGTRAEIQALAANVRNQAAQLEQLCKGLVRRLEENRTGIGKRLTEIEKGTRFLNCVKPPRINYPKFIDSLG